MGQTYTKHQLEQHAKSLEPFRHDLSTITIEKLIDLKGRKELITIPSTSTVEQAINVLNTNNICSAPVWTLTGINPFIGILDMFDFVQYVVNLEDKSPNFSNASFFSDSVFDAVSEAHLLEHSKDRVLSTDDTLKRLLAVLRGGHRVLVRQKTSEEKEKSSSSDFTIISQSDFLRFLMSECVLDRVGLSDVTLEELRLGTEAPMQISSTATALDAFRNLSQAKLSAAPVVDDGGKIVESISITDLRGLTTNCFHDLHLPVGEYLKKHAKHLGHVVTVQTHDTLRRVVGLLFTEKVHRVWVVDGEQRAVGVVTLSTLCAMCDRVVRE
eukprot:Lithocolla_globosa_v1_NODE_1042_length_2921_cov_16.248081.p1 type:complete len:326 gc:universal NODE_1042_length_2921_cov_16.248081:1351-2328(+)